jgi:membrane protease YdiL (CAAX protease family)
MKFNFSTLVDNPHEKRLRAFWRILAFLILYIIGNLSIAFAIAFIKPHFSIQYEQLIRYFLNATIFTFLVWFLGNQIDLRKLTDFGLKLNKKWINEFLIGALIATGVSFIIFSFSYLVGWFEIIGWGWDRLSLVPLLERFFIYLMIMLFVGYYEELIFRGYVGLNIFEGLNGPAGEHPVRGAILSIGIVSVVFAIAHTNNPHFTIFSLTNIFLAGIMLGWPYFFTGSLAMPVGLHFAWNFIQGPVLGLPVSGIIFPNSLVQTSRIGSDFMTGGKFGMEGGLLGSIAILMVLFLVWWTMRKKYDPLQVSSSLQGQFSSGEVRRH